jgi:hypothetical protein
VLGTVGGRDVTGRGGDRDRRVGDAIGFKFPLVIGEICPFLKKFFPFFGKFFNSFGNCLD